MPVLSIRSLRKSFLIGHPHSARRKEALTGVDMEAEEGEIAGIVGAPGAGKTTLLLCGAGLLRRDSGSVFWYGERFSGGGCLPGLAYVPRVPTYYPFLTARDVLENYGVAPNGIAPRLGLHVQAAAQARSRERRINDLGLTPHLGAPVSRLGVDALARLGIAVALAEEPRVLLLDGTLDGICDSAPLAHRTLREAASRGVTVIVTSRDAGALAPLAGRILVLSAGRISGCFSAESVTMRRFAADPPFETLQPLVRQIAERMH